jgi:hypothetical protein
LKGDGLLTAAMRIFEAQRNLGLDVLATHPETGTRAGAPPAK